MADNGKALNTLPQRVERLHSESKGAIASHADHAEDEMVTWLQYPLEDTLERGYCSELFGQLSSTLGKAKSVSDNGVTTGMNNGDCGKSGVSIRSESAEDALALGAGRVSGFVVQPGAEAFNKVKTAKQQPLCPQSSSSPGKSKSSPVHNSGSQMSHEKCKPSTLHSPILPGGFSNASLFANKLPVHGTLPNYPINCMWLSASPSPSTVSSKQGMEKMEFSGSTAAGSTLCELSHLIKENVLWKCSDPQSQISHIQGSSYSRITEDHMRRKSNHSTSDSHGEPLCTALDDAGTSVKLASPFTERRQEKNADVCVVVPDVVVPSCSGGSQTSAEMSAKETSSMEMRKVEYDCQSKDVEGDSADISQPHKRRSKRIRVAESHNLSEKRRRNRINEKLKTLQDLIPNSSKTDKASILDEAIEYLKTLQSQLQMMSSRSGMGVSPMLIPAGMQHMQMAQMAPVHPMGLGLPMVHVGMSMGVGMGMMDFSHGITGRPFQAVPAPSTHCNMVYPMPTAVAPQNCNHAYTSMEVSSSDFLALQQASAQPYQQVHVEPDIVSRAEVHQQGEQFSTPRLSKDI